MPRGGEEGKDVRLLDAVQKEKRHHRERREQGRPGYGRSSRRKKKGGGGKRRGRISSTDASTSHKKERERRLRSLPPRGGRGEKISQHKEYLGKGVRGEGREGKREGCLSSSLEGLGGGGEEEGVTLLSRAAPEKKASGSKSSKGEGKEGR